MVADLDLTCRDLADIRQTGALNKDEFAVALKLIRDKVAGKEVPQTLPASLIPPSLRQSSLQCEIGCIQIFDKTDADTLNIPQLNL